MTNSSGFQWVIAPSQQLIPAINKYGRDALIAVQAVATRWGQDIQNQARVDAPWTDRTPAARPGLFFAVDGFGFGPITGEVTPDAKDQMNDVEIIEGDKNTLVIVLAHTVYYGKYLESPEFEQGGKYAIIMSTIERNLPSLERQLINSLK